MRETFWIFGQKLTSIDRRSIIANKGGCLFLFAITLKRFNI